MAKAIETLSTTDDDALSDALGLPRRYLGVVATGCGRAARAAFGGFGNYQCMSWSPHVATERLTTLKAVIGNWLVTENQAENLSLGSSQQRISVEYPLGSAPQVFPFGGSTAQITVASGAEAESDTLTLTTPIPKGALFRVAHFYANATGTGAILHALPAVMPQTGVYQNFGCNFGPTVADQTATTGVTAPNNQYMLPPLALVAPTRRPSLLLLGDSRVDGAYDSWDLSFDVGEIARTIGQAYGYINLGLFGDTLDKLGTSNTRRAGLGRYCSGAIAMAGINDLASGVTAAACQTRMASLLAALPANLAQRAVCTVAPRPSSTDGFVTDANQTPHAQAAQINVFNDAIRACTIAGQTHMFDVDDAVSSGRKSGKYRNLNGIALTGDGVHMNQTGMQLVKNSGVLNLSAFCR